MAADLKKVESIDVFVLMMSADRLANASLIQNMKAYERLCGGRAVWSNIVVVVPRKDFDPMEMSEVEWKESLKQTEKDVSNFIFKTFEAKPLGVFALS